MSLRVLTPGAYSLLVDCGRPRTRGLGVPVGGPADAASLALGNALVGSPPFAPALEITLAGPTLMAEADVGACVFGAPFQLHRDGDPIPPGHTFTLYAGQTLRIGGTPAGCRAYLCVPGGFHVPKVLDSCTRFEPVHAGEVLDCSTSRLAGRSLGWGRSGTLSDLPDPEGNHSEESEENASGPILLRCLPGPQADWFGNAFFKQSYRVTPASNRMGARLDGPPLALPNWELVSEPVAPGAVQITNDGKPIVLGVDGQTIGGYPKVAHVISADVDALGQLRSGDEVRFRQVTEEEAEAAAALRRDRLQKWLRRIELFAV
jgi:5-oxoprolinase (ATP-hydrolysing) subunit C